MLQFIDLSHNGKLLGEADTTNAAELAIRMVAQIDFRIQQHCRRPQEWPIGRTLHRRLRHFGAGVHAVCAQKKPAETPCDSFGRDRLAPGGRDV